MGIGMKRIIQIHEKLIWKNLLNTTELGSLWSCIARKKEKFKMKGLSFPFSSYLFVSIY